MLSDENKDYEDTEEYKKNKEKAEKEWKAFKEKWENFFRTLWEKFWKLTIGFVIAFNIIYYRTNIDNKDFLDEYTDYLPMPKNMRKENFIISELDAIVCYNKKECCNKGGGGVFPYNLLCIREDLNDFKIKVCDFKKEEEEDGKKVDTNIFLGNVLQILLAGYLGAMKFYRSILSTYLAGKKIEDCPDGEKIRGPTELEEKDKENFNKMIVVIYPIFCYMFFGASFTGALSTILVITWLVVWGFISVSAFGNYGYKTGDIISQIVATIGLVSTGWVFGVYAGAEMIYTILFFPLIKRFETIKKIALKYSPIALILYLLLFVAVAFSTLDKTSSTAIFVVFLYLMWELKKKNDSNK